MEDYFPLSVPMDGVINKEAAEAFEKKKAEAKATGARIPDEEIVRPIIPIESCLEATMTEDHVGDYDSPCIEGKTFSLNSWRMKTFPDFLFVQVRRFADVHGVQSKLDVEVTMPDIWDLSCMKATGLKPGEEEMPAEPEVRSKLSYFVEHFKIITFKISACTGPCPRT